MSLTGGGRMTGGAPAPYLTGSADISWSLDISRKTVYPQHLIGPVLKVCGYRRCRARPVPWLAHSFPGTYSPGLPSVASGRRGGKGCAVMALPGEHCGAATNPLARKNPGNSRPKNCTGAPTSGRLKRRSQQTRSNAESGASRCVLPGPGRGAWSGTSGRPLRYSS